MATTLAVGVDPSTAEISPMNAPGSLIDTMRTPLRTTSKAPDFSTYRRSVRIDSSISVSPLAMRISGMATHIARTSFIELAFRSVEWGYSVYRSTTIHEADDEQTM